MSSVNEPLSQPPPPDPEEQAQAIGGADETDHHVQVDNTQDLDPDKRVRKPTEKGQEITNQNAQNTGRDFRRVGKGSLTLSIR